MRFATTAAFTRAIKQVSASGVKVAHPTIDLEGEPRGAAPGRGADQR